MTELAPRLATFLREYLPRHRGASRHTVESYALCYRLLAVFAAQKHGVRPCRLEIEHLDVATILGFLHHLESNRGNGVRTRNVRLAAIKSFFRFLEFPRTGMPRSCRARARNPTEEGGCAADRPSRPQGTASPA